MDHSNFSLRDEIEYQTNRVNRENQLQNYYNNQGITENYPQYGRDFWNAKQKNDYEWNYTTDMQKQQCINVSDEQCIPKNNNNNYTGLTSLNPDYSQPASLNFDGQYLIWLQNGKPVKYYPAMSGHDDFQSAIYTNVPDDGPIPEGKYVLGKGTGQDYNNKEEMSWWNRYIRRKSPWYEHPIDWGKSRVPIKPLPETNTFGRHSMYVHGGTIPGSAGCIDLTGWNDNFYHDFQNYNGDIQLEVKYPDEW